MTKKMTLIFNNIVSAKQLCPPVWGFGCVSVLLAAGAKPASPYYATLQAYPCTPPSFPVFLPLSLSPSLTKTYVSRLSPPDTSAASHVP